MVKFEAIRIEPTPGEVVDLISEAVASTNRRCRTRLLEDDSVKWRKGARQFQKKAEGWEIWRAGRGGVPASQVMLSWWTDQVGRKHAVIRGRRAESYGDRSYLDRATLETRPALWYCYPDCMYLRKTKAGSHWIVVCDCGATGTPESLGWMGTLCGPCHDLAEERGESSTGNRKPKSFTGPRDEIVRVAMSPDQTFLASADLNGSVNIWSLNDESHHAFRSDVSGVRSQAIGFTGDSKTLVPDTIVHGFQLIGFDVTADPPKEIPLTAANHAPLFVLPWVDGTFCRVFFDGLEWIDPVSRETVRRRTIPIGDAWQVIPSPDCSRLFIRVGNRCTVIDPDDGQILLRPEIWDRDGLLFRDEFLLYVTYSPNFKRIVVSHHLRINLIDGMTGRLIKTVITPGDPFSPYPVTQSHAGLAFDSAGEFLYVCGINGMVMIYRAADLSLLAAFQWHLGYTRGFAISSDSKTLITGGSEGLVKLWPIVRLMATIGV